MKTHHLKLAGEPRPTCPETETLKAEVGRALRSYQGTGFEQDAAILRTEAISSLRGYLATGLAGLKQKGMDRVRALNIETHGSEDLPGGVEAILLALLLGLL